MTAQERPSNNSAQCLLSETGAGLGNYRDGRNGDDGGQVEELPDAKVGEFFECLDFCGFGESQSILYIDTKVADGTFDFRMAKQDLYGTQIARLLINNRCLGTAQ